MELSKNGQRFETVNDLIANKEKTALIKPENYRNRFVNCERHYQKSLKNRA
jgi:hypothetical protein